MYHEPHRHSHKSMRTTAFVTWAVLFNLKIIGICFLFDRPNGDDRIKKRYLLEKHIYTGTKFCRIMVIEFESFNIQCVHF
jgi:hypothetical protein